MTTEPIHVIRALHAAMNAHNAAAAAAFTTADVEIQSPAGEMQGRGAVLILAEAFMTAFPDNEWIEAHQTALGDTVATEYVLEGTHSGPIQTPMGTLTPTGKRVTSRACDVSRVRDGEVYSTHLYWDNLSFMSALGIVPVAQPIPRGTAIGRRWEPDSDADPSANEDIAGRLHDALNAHDVDAVVALAADDVEVVAPTVEDRGREAFAELVGLYLGAFPDIKWHRMHQISSGDTVVTEHLVEGTHQGGYSAPQGEFGPTGNRGVTRVCQVLRVRHGAMESVHLYWDHLVLLQTLGAFS